MTCHPADCDPECPGPTPPRRTRWEAMTQKRHRVGFEALLVLVTFACLVVGCVFTFGDGASKVYGQGTTPAATTGWTPLPAGAAVYASKQGSDTTGNGTQAKPYLTLAKALANSSGATDIYLGAGTWPAIAGWNRSGTASDPVVISTIPGSPSRAIIDGGFSTKYEARTDNVWLVDLDIRAGTADYAVDFLGSGANVRIEGCVISQKIGVRMQASPLSARYTSPTFYRTVVTDTPNANGVYIQGADGLVIDSCAFINAGGKANTRHQTVYVHQSCRNATIVNSIVAYAGAGGFQHRVGGATISAASIDECFGFQCAIPFQLGHPETSLVGDGNVAAFKAKGTIRNSVAVGGMDTGTDPRGFAFWFDSGTFTSEGNIALNGGGSQPVAFSNSNGATTTFTGSLGYNWNKPGEPNVLGSGVTLGAGNDFRYITKGAAAPASVYPSPNQTLAQYAGSEVAYFAGVRGNWKGNWNEKFTARATNAWFRAGVGRGTVTVPPVVEPPVVVDPPTIPPVVVPQVVTLPQGYTVIVIQGTLPDGVRIKLQAAIEAMLPDLLRN